LLNFRSDGIIWRSKYEDCYDKLQLLKIREEVCHKRGGDALIIPWRVDVPEDRLPVVNWLIIASAVTVFVFQTISISERAKLLPEKMREYKNRSVEDMAKEFGVEKERLKEIEQWAEKTQGHIKDIAGQLVESGDIKDMLVKQAILKEYFVQGQVRPFILTGWTLKGFFGHIWLHGGILHLLGNMLFLWIFGNAVCAKIGNFKYLPIYIGLGLVAGLSQLVFSGQGSLGASGAINGIVGMYLVFFPTNEITCYFFIPFLIRPKEFCLSSYWMVLFWLAFDIWGAMSGGGEIAYFAHLGGFVGGVILAILMLKLKIVKMERYEKSLLQLIDEHIHPPKEEIQPQYGGYLGLIQKEMEEKEQPAATKPTEPNTIPFEPPTISSGFDFASPGKIDPPISKDEFIHFICSCGKRLKMPSKFAGKMGKCPNCNARLRIPDK
jgi:membrane associated rhomboid family serine protease